MWLCMSVCAQEGLAGQCFHLEAIYTMRQNEMGGITQGKAPKASPANRCQSVPRWDLNPRPFTVAVTIGCFNHYTTGRPKHLREGGRNDYANILVSEWSCRDCYCSCMLILIMIKVILVKWNSILAGMHSQKCRQEINFPND